MTIAERIASAMTERDINQNQLARATGLSPGYLSNIQKRNPRRMDTDIAAKIARALGVSTAWLLTGSDVPDDPVAPTPAPVSDVHVSRSAAREMVRAAWNQDVHAIEDAQVVEDALMVGAPFVRDLDPTEYVRRLLDTAARCRKKGQSVEGKDLHSATVKSAFEESRDLRTQLERQREFEARAKAWLEANGIDPETMKPHAPSPKRPTATRPGSGTGRRLWPSATSLTMTPWSSAYWRAWASTAWTSGTRMQ